MASSGLTEMTGADCADIMSRLRRALGTADIDLDQLTLRHDLADVEWLSAFPGVVLRTDGGPSLIDHERTVDGFRDAAFVKRSTKALERASSLAGFAQKAKHIKNWRLHPPVRGGNREMLELADQAGDHLYEVETAARLSFSMGGLRFDEPDLLYEEPSCDFRFGIACKRPRKIEGFVRCIRRAAEQVRRKGTLGVALVSVDNLVKQVVMDASGRNLKEECHARIGRVIKACSAEVLQILEGAPPVLPPDDPKRGSGFLGVIATGSFFLAGRDGTNGPAYLNTAFVPSMINKNEPAWARKVLWALLHLIERGEGALIDMP